MFWQEYNQKKSLCVPKVNLLQSVSTHELNSVYQELPMLFLIMK